jgi:hypothetical protein
MFDGEKGNNMKLYTEEYRVTGTAESIIQFNHLLALINVCCLKGKSRNITIHVDGDGSANLTIERIYSKEDMKNYGLKEENQLVEVDTTALHKLILWATHGFYGDDEQYKDQMHKEIEEEYEEILSDIQKFMDGEDIRINIGE